MDAALKALLAWWDDAGVDIPEIKTPPKRPPVRQSKRAKSPTNKTPTKAPPPMASSAKDMAQKATTLDALRTAVSDFDAGALSDLARQAVFSRGNPEADIMVIGEAPGRDEDRQGQPFVGRSGQLLDKILASIGLTEDNVYITNVVNWRPPKNRNPTADEITLCLPIIHRHIELIDPRLIVLVGGVSLSALTGESGIMKNRGQWKDLQIGNKTYPALPVYHPAFLLRQPALKKDVWRDMLALRERISQL